MIISRQLEDILTITAIQCVVTTTTIKEIVTLTTNHHIIRDVNIVTNKVTIKTSDYRL